MPQIQVGCAAKGLEKARQKTVSIIEAKSILEAEAMTNLGFEFVGVNEEGTAFEFKEPSK